MTMLKLKQSLGRWQDGLAEVGWNSLYLGNHDQPRCVSRFGSDAPEHREQSAKALATVLHLHRGTPYVYQGDELGMSNAGFRRLDQLRDVESLNHYATAVARGEDPADVMRALVSPSTLTRTASMVCQPTEPDMILVSMAASSA